MTNITGNDSILGENRIEMPNYNSSRKFELRGSESAHTQIGINSGFVKFC